MADDAAAAKDGPAGTDDADKKAATAKKAAGAAKQAAREAEEAAHDAEEAAHEAEDAAHEAEHAAQEAEEAAHAHHGHDPHDEHDEHGHHEAVYATAADDPVDYGWEPLPEEPSAQIPLAATIILGIGVAALAFVRIDALLPELDFDNAMRSSIRLVVGEAALILVAGTAVMTGALAPKLSAGAKAALILVGAVLLIMGIPLL